LEGSHEWVTDPARVMLALNEHRWAVVAERDLLWYEDSTLVGRTPLPPRTGWFMVSNDQVVLIDSSGNAYRSAFRSTVCLPASVTGWPSQGGKNLVPTDIFWQANDSVAVVLFNEAFFLLHPDKRTGAITMEDLDASLPGSGRPTDVIWHAQERILVIGTPTKGLFVCQRTGFKTHISAPGTTAYDAYYAQVPIGSDGVIALNGSTPVHFEGNTARALRNWPVIPSMEYAAPLPNGHVMVLSLHDIVELDPFTGVHSFVARSCPHSLTSLLPERDTIWVGSSAGVGALVNGVYRDLLSIDPLRMSGVTFLRRGPDGLIWMGTHAGLYRLSPRTWIPTQVQGSEDLTVRSMSTIRGLVFIGTYGDGTFVLKDGRLVPFPLDRAGSATHVHAFMLDAGGYLWRSTNHGLFRCKMSEVEAWVKDPSLPIYQEYFGTRAGIGNVEFNGGCDPAALRLPNGLFSFPSMDGIVQFDPDQVSPPDLNEHILFERVFVDDRKWPLDEYLMLPHTTKKVAVQFSFGYWNDPLNLQLEYQLDGADSAWIPLPPEQRELVLSNLPTGEYVLRLRSAGSRAIPKDRLPSIWFTVLRPWYAKPWAIIAFSLSAIALAGIGVRIYTRGLARQNTKLERVINDRTRTLTETNTALERSLDTKARLVSIISHDIVSPLRFIAQVARSAKNMPVYQDKDKRTALGDIHFAAERLHGNAQNLLNWVKQQEGGITPQPRHVVMNLLIEELFDRVRSEAQAKGLRLENEVLLDDVLMVDKDLLTIALNNLLMNAVSYTEKGFVRFSASTVENTYYLILTDSGPGFSAEARAQLDRIRTGDNSGLSDAVQHKGLQGLGYVIVSGVMTLLGGDFEVVGEGGKGTTVVLQLPVKAGK
jgi:signal transduction histidine kinase